MGRPRMRWLEHVEKDTLEMKAKRWRQKAVEREDRAFAIKEAKTLRRPQRLGAKESIFDIHGVSLVIFTPAFRQKETSAVFIDAVRW